MLLRRPIPGPTVFVTLTLVVVVVLAGGVVAGQQDSFGATAAVVGATLVACVALYLAPQVHPALPIGVGLLLSVMSGRWDYVGIPLGLDRPLVVYGILCALLRLLPDAQDPWRIPLGRVHLLGLVVAAIGIGSAISAGTFGEANPTFALSETLGILGFCIFTVTRVAFASERSRDLLLIGFLVLASYLGITACLEGLGAKALVFPRFIVNPLLGIHADRARGPFLDGGQFGLALFVGVVVAAIAFVRWRRPSVRLLCVAIATACVLGIVFTVTRQAWVGAIVGTVLAMALTPSLRRYLLPVAGAGAVLVLLTLALVPGLRTSASQRSNDRLPVYDRLNSDRAAFEMAKAKPILGFGWYSFPTTSLPFLEQAATYPLRSVPIAHNVFLGTFAELGFVGGSLWVLLLSIVIGTAIIGRAPPSLDPWRVGLIAIAADWFIVANLAPIAGAFTNHMLWFWSGIVWAGLPPHAVTERIREVRARAGKPFQPLAPGARVGVLIGAALAFAAVGFAVAQVRSPTYSARTELAVGPYRVGLLNYPFYESGRETWASTWARLGTADRVLEPAAADLGIPTQDLRRGVVITPRLNRPEISVRATAGSREEALARSRAVADSLTRTANAFNRQQATLDRLQASFRTANRAEARTRTDSELIVQRLGGTGKTLEELSQQQLKPLFAAEARAQASTIERIVAGLRFSTLAGADRGQTDLRQLEPATIFRTDKTSFAELMAYLAGLVGLAVGALVGLFPPRRRSRSDPDAPAVL